jgi:two-component system chemotaxis response regulator CheY
MSVLPHLRILVVDDEPFMRRTIKAMLRVVGRFTIVEAGDGETAFRLLPAARPDVILCDINMEPISGLQFVQRLRTHSDQRMRETAVVMLTVHADEATILAVADLRINGYLVKPSSPKLLGDRLRTIFRDHMTAGV